MPTSEELRQQLVILQEQLREITLAITPLGFLVKIYPAIKSPDSGDEFPPSHVLPVSVTSNSSLLIEILVATEGFFGPLIVVPPVPVPLAKVPLKNKWEGMMNITLPGGTGDYLLICRTAGDSLVVPSNHIDKVAITVKL